VRTLITLCCAAALALVQAPGRAADGPSSAPAATLRLAVAGDPHTLLPILQTTQDESYLASLVYDSLVEFDGNNRPQPELVTEIPTRANHGISADGKTITVHLRHNVRWHDGTAFTSGDVVATIMAIVDEKNTVANRSFFTNIASVTTRDRYTVTFRLRSPQASFLATVASVYPILPQHLLAKSTGLATDPLNGQPVGTGPYRFVRWTRGEGLEYAANPDYFAGAPRLARISVRVVPDQNTMAILLRQHAIDFALVTSSTYGQLRDITGAVRKTEPTNDFVAYAMNAARPLLRDLRVRRAIVRAVDRTKITNTVTFGTGTPAYADLPLFMYGGRPPAGWNDYDPAAARGLLDAAGWKVGPGGVRTKNGVALRLALIDFNGNPTMASIAVQVQQMLRRVGIDTIYKSYSQSLYYSPASAGGPFQAGNFDLAAFSFGGGVDPSNGELYTCASRIPAGFNAANYCSAEMDRLQREADGEYDQARRDAVIARIEALAVRDATYLFLYHTPYRLIVNPTLQRPTASIGNVWYDMRTWTFAPN